MKRIAYIILLLFVISNCLADVPVKVRKSYKHIVKLIEEKKADELSKLISYPLKRQNPLPDITNAKAFIAYYNILFDDAFRKKLRSYNDSVIFNHNAQYGLVGGIFNGDMWIGDDGKIVSINYSSKQELKLKDQLTKQIQNKMHPSVNSWKENIWVAKSKNLLIRIDETNKGFRYVSWSHGHSISDKPDLILYHGKEEAQGTMGGWTYTFKSGDWTYEFDDVEMCETDDKCGLFLRMYYKDDVKSAIRLTAIK
ncbi:hypothetical protein [Mucilaginibacter polytrichastri]|uniref:Uncharacterized protein n=1 Tax=Mucilaginibacter polytrichastri TaxID=1302689 RepID=A0A1Q6A0Z6_9SPHI|nr:hypothetical protein [Mucilaginibacter polytrichastri]OKS87652.1 hypothetical protein RG47T_3114 [Mucilaginibacter polytrichastri]SFS93356.1 hypothetical protein SAMN04487890_106245 [Mucilaginibacter polytrichastri]